MIRLMLLLAVTTTASAAAPREAARGRCDAARAQMYVGALGTAPVGRTVLARTRAKTMRWLAPSTLVTMDYRTDRVNIALNERNFVTQITCG